MKTIKKRDRFTTKINPNLCHKTWKLLEKCWNNSWSQIWRKIQSTYCVLRGRKMPGLWAWWTRIRLQTTCIRKMARYLHSKLYKEQCLLHPARSPKANQRKDRSKIVTDKICVSTVYSNTHISLWQLCLKKRLDCTCHAFWKTPPVNKSCWKLKKQKKVLIRQSIVIRRNRLLQLVRLINKHQYKIMNLSLLR